MNSKWKHYGKVKDIFILLVSIPAEAGIQEKQRNWIPHQVRNDGEDGELPIYHLSLQFILLTDIIFLMEICEVCGQSAVQ
ncbi:MAG: hypothetical protein AB1478_03435, partial [Nitrospirota bacterium]